MKKNTSIRSISTLLPGRGIMNWAWTMLAALVVCLGSQVNIGAQNVIISEFNADNYLGDPGTPAANALLDEDGDASDWIELFNNESTAVNLGGWALTDNAHDPLEWVFPNVTIPAKGFLVVFASGKDRRTNSAYLHTSFSLNPDGEYLGLIRPDLSVATEFDPFPKQHTTYSYGVGQVSTGLVLIGSNAPVRVLVPPNNSLGTLWMSNNINDVTWTRGTNGVGYESAQPGLAIRYIKAATTVDSLTAAEGVIANPPTGSVYLTNMAYINCNDNSSDGHYGSNFPFPNQSVGQAVDDFVLEITGTITIPTAGNWTFGVNSDDGFGLAITNSTTSFTMSNPGVRGAGDTLQVFNFASAGDYALRLVYFERGGGAEVEFFAASGSYSAWGAGNFHLVGDTANGGLTVRSAPAGAGVGSGYRSMINTDIQAQMYNVNASVYLRYPFIVTNLAQYSSLTLRVKYDDGFVAYLNGAEVGRRNAPSVPAWNSRATTNHSAAVYEDIALTDRMGLLQLGTNILAIQGLNAATNDYDFLIEAELVDYHIVNTTNQYFASPTPGGYNGQGIPGFVEDTKFSVDRGFFDSPISLVITSATVGATIIYTTNGSVPSLTNGTVYSAPILINRTTILRAAAFKSPLVPTDVDTHTYIFVNDVVSQSPNGEAPTAEWPSQTSSAGQIYNYGMDQRIVTDPSYSSEIRDDLKAIPSFSLVMKLPDLFDNSTGIYANPSGDEIAWERPGSVELINPDGTTGFQINCGVRVRGGYSRSGSNPKHAFRLFFRQQYGASKLHYPLHGDLGTDTFNKIDLRTFENYSWSFDGSSLMICNRDQFARDTQLAMGQQATRGNFYHLYVNGQYWGIYNTEERADAAFGESYFGGNKDNYDTIKVDPDLGYDIEATDGDTGAWNRLWNAAVAGFTNDVDYYKIQGLNLDGTPNPAYENLIDIDNLIDYMLVILYGGNLDAPISNFLGNDSPNNFFAVRDRTGTNGGFRIMAHDSEHTLLDLNVDRTGIVDGHPGQINSDWTAGDPSNGSSFLKSNPQYFWFRLQCNAEFRMRVADHIQKHLFNGGALSPEGAAARMSVRSNQLWRAIVCESARWGDSKHPDAPFTRNTWISTWDWVTGTFIPGRTAVLLGQLQADLLFPSNSAPSASSFGGMVAPGYALYLTNSNPAGTIFYTIDGSDPRLRGGLVASNAVPYTTPIYINSFVWLRARVLIGSNTWSPIIETKLYPSQSFSDLMVTEIMYNPPVWGLYSGDDLEFLELKNVGTNTLDLSGLFFSSAINFTFTNGTTLGPGQFFVLGRNRTALTNKYPGLVVNGIYTGKLDNGGETIALSHILGGVVLSFGYKDSGRWPSTADGLGFSLVPCNPNANPNPGSPVNWRASAFMGGSPGADDPASSIPAVYVNEALSASVAPDVDVVELFNPNSFDVNIGGWYLTDNRALPKKYRIPDGRTIPAFGFLLFTEADFNPTPGTNNSFALNASGDEIHLFSGDASTNLTGYSHGYSFDAAESNVTFGRYMNSIGDEFFVAQSTNTLGGTNALPKVGPVIIKQIMYKPFGPTTNDNILDEYVELFNITGEPVSLFDTNYPTNTWRIRGGISLDFPANLVIGPAASVVLVNFAPTNTAQLASFTGKFPLFAGLPIVGPYSGKLGNDDDDLLLSKPDAPTSNNVPYVLVEEVHYHSSAPWPPGSYGTGKALMRRNFAAFGNDPANWTDLFPLSITSQPQSLTNYLGNTISFTVEARGEGVLHYQWRFYGTNLSSALNPTVTNATLVLTNITAAMDGNYTVAVSDGVNSILSAPATFTALMAAKLVALPQHLTLPVGQSASFTAGARGLPFPLYWKWTVDAKSITYVYQTTMETNSTLTLENVQLTNGGNYQVTVTNYIPDVNTVQSPRRFLTVVVPPANQAVQAGSNVTLRVTASTGRYPLRGYQWQFNNTNIAGATSSNLFLTNFQAAFSGTYTVWITNYSNYAASFSASVVTTDLDSDGDGIPDWWEIAHGMNPHNAADALLDSDGDGMSNYAEFIAGTDPSDPNSYLRIDMNGVTSAGAVLTFMAVSNRTYNILSSDTLATNSWVQLTNFVAGPANRTINWTNTSPAAASRYYRLVIPPAH